MIIRKLILLIILSVSLPQEIPEDFFINDVSKILFDIGKNWEANTTFGPMRYQGLNIEKTSILSNYLLDSTKIKFLFGARGSNKSLELYSFLNAESDNFYVFSYPRIVSNSEQISRFTGLEREIKRAGFSSGETDLSGLGFQNKHYLFQIGRGRESWGAGNDIQLALNATSPPYDYIKLGFNHEPIRFRYFHGFLENKDNYNRYITGRGLEISNEKSLILGLSETVIYSGLNRPLDFSYFNPISTHLEIELNNRQNLEGTQSGNAVWQASVDYLIKENMRLSGNFLVDEFVFDKIQIDSGKVHGLAWSFRLSYSPKIKNNVLLFHGTYIHVGTHTFRHELGYNNFVHRSYPLGWEYGSDGQELKLGVNYLDKNKIIKFNLGRLLNGSSSIIKDNYKRYDNYNSGPFPSGEVNKTTFINFEFKWWLKSRFSINGLIEYKKMNDNRIIIENKIGFDIFYSS